MPADCLGHWLLSGLQSRSCERVWYTTHLWLLETALNSHGKSSETNLRVMGNETNRKN